MAWNNRKLSAHSSGGQKSEIKLQQDHTTSRASKGVSFFGSSSFWQPQCSLACKCVTPIFSSIFSWLFSSCVPVFTWHSLFYKDTSHNSLRSALCQYDFILTTSTTTLFTRLRFKVLGVRCQHIFLWDTTHLITTTVRKINLKEQNTWSKHIKTRNSGDVANYRGCMCLFGKLSN